MEHLHQHPLVTSDILSTDYRSGGLLKCARTVVHHAEYSTMPSMVCTMLWNTNASPAQRGIRCCLSSTVGYQRLAGAETYPACNEAVQSCLSILYWAARSTFSAVIPRLELLPYLLCATFLLLIPCLELISICGALPYH